MKKIKHKKRIAVAALLLSAVAAFSYPGSPVPQLTRIAADQIGIKAVTDFAVIVNSGNTLEMQSFSSTGIYRTNGTVAAGDLATVTVTRPDTTTFSFRQRIDTDGRIRGLLFGENLNQVGAYTLTIAADNGGTNSGQFGVRTKPVLSNDNVFTGNNTFTGTFLHQNAVNSADVFQIKNATGTDILDVNTLTSTVTAANLTVTGTCTGCGSDTLQSAYNLGNTITTTDARDIDVTLANTSTDSNFILDIATSSTSEFQVENNGTDVLQIGSAGQLQLDTQGSGGGLLIGTDVNLYRTAADVLRTDDIMMAPQFSNIAAPGTDRLHLESNATRYTAVEDAGTLLVRYDDNSSSTGTIRQQNLSTDASGGSQIRVDLGDDASNAINASVIRTIKEGAWTTTASTQDSAMVLRTTADGTSNEAARLTSARQLQLPGTTSTAGILIGGDANLYRSAADSLRTDDAFRATGTITSDGDIQLGSTGSFRAQNQAAAGTQTIQVQVSGDANNRLRVDADGEIQWGDGSVVPDTNLYRSAADVLKTDDTLALGTLGTADTSTALCRNTSEEVATCTSSREYKQDIEPLNDHQYQSILETIAGTDIFTFRYKGPDTALRTGVIAENLPKELTPTIDPKGNPQPDWFSIYGYLWAGEKELANRVKALEARLDEVERAPAQAASSERGANAKVERGKKRLEVRFDTPRPDADYAIQVTPGWVTAYGATKKTVNGFVIEFEKKAPKNASVDWTVVQ